MIRVSVHPATALAFVVVLVAVFGYGGFIADTGVEASDCDPGGTTIENASRDTVGPENGSLGGTVVYVHGQVLIFEDGTGLAAAVSPGRSPPEQRRSLTETLPETLLSKDLWGVGYGDCVTVDWPPRRDIDRRWIPRELSVDVLMRDPNV